MLSLPAHCIPTENKGFGTPLHVVLGALQTRIDLFHPPIWNPVLLPER